MSCMGVSQWIIQESLKIKSYGGQILLKFIKQKKTWEKSAERKSKQKYVCALEAGLQSVIHRIGR